MFTSDYMTVLGEHTSGPVMDNTALTVASSLLNSRLGHSALLNREPSPETENDSYSRIPNYCR